MAENETPIVVCDAGPIIHLEELDCLNLLADFREVLVPDAVWLEVEHHRPEALARPKPALTHIPPPASIQETLIALAQALSLDTGEIEALALMAKHPDAILLTDDAAARLVADQQGFRVHGTIGILIRAIRRNQRSPEEVVALLRDLPRRSSLHIRPGLLVDIIDEVAAEYGLS